MPFCTKCGQQNSDTTKFCTKCGTPLKTITAPVPVIPEPAKQVPVTQAPFIQNAALKKNNWVLPVVIGGAVVVIAVVCYFVFIKNNNGDQPQGNNTNQTPVTNNPTQQLNTPKKEVRGNSETTPVQSTLLQRMSVSDNNITDQEIITLTQNLNSLYTAENNKDYATALNYFSYPITRYYNFSNLSYQQMNDVYLHSDTKLSYHENLINLNKSLAEKNSYGYRLIVYGDYKFTTMLAPDSVKTHAVNAELLLNNDFKIFSVKDNK